MKTVTTLLITAFHLIAAPAKESIVVKDIQVNTRGKAPTTLHVFVSKRENPAEFIKAHRCVSGMWDYSKLGRAKESPTHWTGSVHYPTFNFRPDQLYMIDQVKIVKKSQIDALPMKERDKITHLFTQPGRGQVVLRETGRKGKYEMIGYSKGDTFALFKLNPNLKYTPQLKTDRNRQRFRTTPLRLHLMQHRRAPGLQAAVVPGQAGRFFAATYELLQFAIGGLKSEVQEKLL